MCITFTNRIFLRLVFAVLIGQAFVPSAMASSDQIQIQTVPYKTTAGISQPLVRFGGKGNDWAREIFCVADDSCTVFGFTQGSFGNSTRSLVLQFTSAMTVKWAETFGNTHSNRLWHAINTIDGGYFTVGDTETLFTNLPQTWSAGLEFMPIYVKLDNSGKVQWAGSIFLSGVLNDSEVNTVTQTADGGYLLAGTYTEAIPESGYVPSRNTWSAAAPGKTPGWEYTYPLLLKLSANGKPQWIRRYAFGTNGGAALGVAELPSGNIVLAGSIYVDKTNNLFVLETDKEGVPLSANQYELPQRTGVLAMRKIKDGNYMIGGYVNTNSSHAAYFALFSPTLKFIRGTIYQNPAGVRPLSFVQGSDGRICVVGRTENPQTNKAEGVAWLIDEQGADLGELWIGGQGNTELESAAQLSAGEYQLLGDTDAFGAADFDLFTTRWNPSSHSATNDNRLSSIPFTPKINEVNVTSDTASLRTVVSLKPDVLSVRNLTAELSSQDAH